MLRCALPLLLAVLLSGCGIQEFRQLQIQTEFALALRPPLEQARRQSGLQAMAQQFDALENRMRVAQQRYQLATRRHNELLASFPTSLTARVQGLQPQALLAGLP